MAEGNDKLSFELDLDAREMLEGLNKVQESLDKVGSSEFKGLLSGLSNVAQATGVVAAAFLAAKTSLEAVFEAEKIKATNAQFEALAKNAGIFGEDLKEALTKSSRGLVSQQDLLAASNKALVELGGSAEKLPEIMELARRYSASFGTDLMQTFEHLNLAIATGSTHMLKHMGITVNLEQAYKKFADTHGIAVSSMNDEAQKQARLNAILEEGNKKLVGVNEGVIAGISSWQRLKVAIAELGEIAVKIFDKIFGETIIYNIQRVTDLVTHFARTLTANWGDGAEKAKAKQEILNESIGKLAFNLRAAEIEQSKFAKGSSEYVAMQSGIDKMKERLAQMRGEYAANTKEVEHFEEANKKAKESLVTNKKPSQLEDPEKKKANEAKFQKSLLQLHQERLTAETQATASWADQEKLALEKIEQENERHKEKMLAIAASKDLDRRQRQELEKAETEAHEARLAEIESKNFDLKIKNIEAQKQATMDEAQFDELVEQQKQLIKQQASLQLEEINQREDLNEQERAQRRIELEMQTQAEITKIQQQAFSERDALVQRSVYQSNNAAEQFAAGFASGSKRAANDLSNFGKQGQFVFTSLTSHASNAFIQLGEGTKKGSDVMRGAFFGMMADIAQNYGQMLLGMSILPPNPAGLAAGAGLLVLSGYLRSQSNKGGAGGGAPQISVGGNAAGGGDLGSVAQTPAQAALADQQQIQAKSVHLEVHGSIMDSDTTRQRIAQLVRDSMDSTDYSVAKIGGGI